ncbi:hypothetical protein [Polymorphospora rubra]|uniref:hypothetical protein n=1 Tax=Polymorphospora rubra TaxID=338584 RepID=UPI0033FF1C9E
MKGVRGCRLCFRRVPLYLASDIRLALTRPDDVPAQLLAERLGNLKHLVVERDWWTTP